MIVLLFLATRTNGSHPAQNRVDLSSEMKPQNEVENVIGLRFDVI